MSFNGSGTFVINSSGQPVVANTVISSTVFNALTADLATGLSTCITKDGQTTPTANIPMGTFKFTNLGNGSAATDSATLGQVQASTTKLITVSGTDTLTGTLLPVLTAYVTGQMFYFVAGATNTGAVTLNIDSLGVRNVTRHGSVALVAGDILSGEVCVVLYDGTRFQLLNPASYTNLNVTGVLSLAAGTALLPSLAFSGDSNTGLWSPAADTLALSTGGVERWRVSSSGNFGVGTSTPIQKFEVYADTNALVSARVVQDNLGTSAIAALRLDTQGNSWSIRSGRDGGYLSFHDAGGERARLDNAGNLGIGTASPVAKLSVQDALVPKFALQVGAAERAFLSYTESTFTTRLDSDGPIELAANNAVGLTIRTNRNVSAGVPSLATTATDGFLYVPTCAGVPTGTPTAVTGMVPIVVDTTNNRWYFYSGGAWRNAGP